MDQLNVIAPEDGDGLSPYRRFSRDEWAKLRADAPDDADRRRGAAAAIPQRSDLPRRGGGDLPAALAPALSVCGRDAGAVSRHPALPAGRERRQGSLYHRRGGVGGGWKIHHRPRPQGAAGALAQHAEGRSRHHRRVPPAQCRARPARADGAKGLSRELRYRRAAALSRRHQGRASATSRRRSIPTSSTTWCRERRRSSTCRTFSSSRA